MKFEATYDFAVSLDKADPLQDFRNRFHLPQREGKKVLYFCGNSLGLQPKSVEKAILEEMSQWRDRAIDGFFEGERPWLPYHVYLQPKIAPIVGALNEEVVVMNTLTVNLHLLMVSFYRPTAKKYKILMEAGAFPSDQYAVESQVKWHGFLPQDAIIEVSPRPGEYTLRTEDVLNAIGENREEIALVLFGGVNYYTGQYHDMHAITKSAHSVGALAGFDLAHAAGNVLMKLHDWDVDFACWCSYKYLNAGPGGPGGIFVHEKHGNNPDLPRFAGWWGYDEKERFRMKKGFKHMTGAAGWQISTPQILNFASLRASLDIFSEVGMHAIRDKSVLLTGYLEYLIKKLIDKGHPFKILTPENPAERGCQISILTGNDGKFLFEYLLGSGVVTDWREPNVIRISPVPMYNRYVDVWQLASLLASFKV
jgi:kynureninase